MQSDQAFPESYQQAQERFQASLSLVRASWSAADLVVHPLAGDETLSMEWIRADAQGEKKRCLIITTGLHGVEGYVGAAVLRLFQETFLPKLNPDDTGVVLVQPINPWGMKHQRRTNANNVDLNRNFILEGEPFPIGSNEGYREIRSLLNPKVPLTRMWLNTLVFPGRLLWKTISLGMSRFQDASLRGQYRFPRGVYYGGQEHEEETRVMMGLFRDLFQKYDQLLHLDVHTGYGPRYGMTLVNSPLEEIGVEEWKTAFDYPRLVSSDPEAFYAISGDMIDWVYRFKARFYPDKQLYATAFEFGTLGDSLPAVIQSLKATVDENQVFWQGTPAERIQDRVRREYRALFYPQEQAWQDQALADAARAFQGILRAQGFLG